MGVSTDGILFWGYCSSEEGTLVPEDWIGQEAVRRGHPNPWDEYPADIDQIKDYKKRQEASDKWVASKEQELDAWYDAKKVVENEFGVVVGFHGADSYALPYLTIKESVVCAGRGYPKQVTGLVVGTDWQERLERFCDHFQVTRPNDRPDWWLVSYWG